MNKKAFLLGLLVVIIGLCVLAMPHKALAATFSVDSTADTGDASAGDGSCDTGGGVCTLRAAIEETNALAGADTINFNISGSGVHTIAPGSQLTITDQVTIDGESQTGANCGTLVPTNLPTSNTPHTLLININPTDNLAEGLFIDGGGSLAADGSVIRGLIINGAVAGIEAANASNVTLECNYIGTDEDGSSTVNNSASGIVLHDNTDSFTIQNNLIAGSNDDAVVNWGYSANIQNNLIGSDANGTNALGNNGNGILSGIGDIIAHNIIVGSTGSGIITSNNSSIQAIGNYIGVGIDGSALGNDGDGLTFFSTSDNTVGGTAANQRNIISGNAGDGIHIYNNCNGSGPTNANSMFNNYIGTTVDGLVESGYGNGKAGIEVNEYNGGCVSVYRQQIGGDNAGEPNIIAGNAAQGILVHQDNDHDVFSISIVGNAIFSNGSFGIDLASDSDIFGTAGFDLGPNPLNNLPITYPTAQANNYLNHPVINSATQAGSNLAINYTFSAPTITESDDGYSLTADKLVGYRLDFYLNDKKTDGSYAGYAQGQTHLGSFVIDGSETHADHSLATSTSLDGKYITATATIVWKKLSASCPSGDGQARGDGPPYTILTCNGD